MGSGKRGAAAPWVIALVALACSIWAVVDFVAAARPDAPAHVTLQQSAQSAARGPIELHRLLPAAPEDVGTLVLVDGTVIGKGDRDGFWVRDLRDNVVRVRSSERPESGKAVRVVGRLARLAGTAHPPSGAEPGDRVVAGLQVVASGPGAIEAPVD